MAGTPTPIYPQTIKNWAVQILPADTTTLKTLVTGAANGSVVEMINVHSTDTANKDLVLYLTIGGVDYPLFTTNIPLNSGNTNAIAAVAPMNNTTLFPSLPFNNSGNKFIYVASGTTLRVAVTASVTAARAISITAHGGDY